MKHRKLSGFIVVVALALGLSAQVMADAVYSSYMGSQQGVTIRDVNTLNQYVFRNTGINATGIAVDSDNNFYLPSANQIRKYNLTGSLLVNMTFPISSIVYTDVAVSGNKLYASYRGSQQGVTIRNTSNLNQLSFFNTGINASGIAVDSAQNIYLAAANHIRKYNSSGRLLVDMTFPDARINYTAVSVKGNYVYATYTGSQQGVTKRDISTLNQVQFFNTGVNADGISLDAQNNIYISAGNSIRKYRNNGTLVKNMTFPDTRIIYTGIAIK